MSVRKRLIGILCGVLLAAGIAGAKPPAETDLPRFRAIVDDVKKALDEALRAAAEAARDVDQEFLDAYAAEKINATEDHRRIVEIIDDRSLERDKPGIREKAALIVARRWPHDRAGSLQYRRVLGNYLIPLLGQRGHDEKSNALAIAVLKTLFNRDCNYKLDSSWRDRNDAIRDWKKFLKK